MLKRNGLKTLIFIIALSCNKITNIKYSQNNKINLEIDDNEESDDEFKKIRKDIENIDYEVIEEKIDINDNLESWCIVDNIKNDLSKSKSFNDILTFIQGEYDNNNCIKFDYITGCTINKKQKKKYNDLFTNDADYICEYNNILKLINKENDLYFQFLNPIKKFPTYKGINFIKKGIYKLKKNKNGEHKGANGVIYVLKPYKDSKNCKIIDKSEEDFLIIKLLMPTSKVGLPNNIYKEFKKELRIYELLYGAKNLRKYAVPTVMAHIDKVPILIKKYVSGGTLKKLIEEDKADGKKLCDLYRMMVNIKELSDCVIKDLHAQNLMYDTRAKNWKIVDADLDLDESKNNNAGLLIQLKTSSNKNINKVAKMFGSYKWAFDKQRHIEMINTVNKEIKNIYTSNVVKDKSNINIKSDFLEGLEKLYLSYPQEFSLEYLFRNKKAPISTGNDIAKKEKIPLLFLVLLNKTQSGRYGDISSLNYILKYFPKLVMSTVHKNYNLDIIQFLCLFGLHDILIFFLNKYPQKIDINKKDKYGQTYLHLLANKNKLKAFYKDFSHQKDKLPSYKVISHDYINGNLGIDRLKIADELITNYHIPNDAKDGINGDTVLHLCCKSKYLNLYKHCLFLGCNDTILNNFCFKPSKYYQCVNK